MRQFFALAFALAPCVSPVLACGSDDDPPPNGSGAKAGTAGSSGSAGRGGTSNDGGGTSGAAGSSGGGGCERFGFVASGAACPQSGCSSFSCSCPDAFPKSVASCTDDGCLVGGNCSAICAGDLGDALDCTDIYTVRPGTGGTGGTGGGAGTAGTGGSGGVVRPPCSMSDVQRAPAAAQLLGNVPSLEATALLTDETGAIYVGGTVGQREAVDFGGGALAAGGGNFLLKLDGQRRHVWSKRFGAAFGIEQVKSLKFAANGDLLVGGVTSLDADLGGGPKPHATGPQFYVARYTRSGAFVQGHVILTANSIPTLSSVIEAPSGEYLLIGSFLGTVPFGATMRTSAGEADAFIARVSSTGSLIDVRQYGRQRNDLVFDAVSASDGTLYLLGFSYHAVDFGQNPIELGSNGLSYVVALDSALRPIWQKLVGSGGAYPRRALLDGGTLVVAGDAYGNVYYGDQQTGALPTAHTFVFRIDRATGALERGDTYDTSGNGAQITSLAGFGDGIAIGGHIGPNADFGGGPLTSSQVAQLPFVARFDATGRHVWSTLFCSSQTRGVSAITAAGSTPVVALPFQYDLELGAFRFPGRGTALLEMAP
jgi:hypothetical protein